MRRTDVILTGLTIAAIGVAVWTVLETIHGQSGAALFAAGVACLGAFISLYGLIFMREPEPIDQAKLMRTRTRERLLAHVNDTLMLTQRVKGDDDLRARFWNECRVEMQSLRDFVQDQYGMMARDRYMDHGPSTLGDVSTYADAVKELADRIDKL